MPSLNVHNINARHMNVRPIFTRPMFTRPMLALSLISRRLRALVLFFPLFMFPLYPATAQMTASHGAANSSGSAHMPPTGAFSTAMPGRSVTAPALPATGAARPPAASMNLPVPGVVNSHVSSFTTGANGHEHHRHHGRDDDDSRARPFPVIYGFAYPYPVEPYAGDDTAPADNAYTDDAAADNDPDYQGGPTVFDRRGSGEDSYVPPVEDSRRPHSEQPAAEATPQQPTLLVFKDAHKIEVENYAIVGDTLFDLTPGHARRVALASLDLDATRQQNEDRGVIFQLPSPPLGD